MVSNKLGEARAFNTKGWLKRLLTQTVLKTTERGSWIRPHLAKNDDLSLTHSARHPQQTEKNAQQKDTPSLALAGLLGITLIPAFLGITLKEEKKGALTLRLTYRGWVAYSQWA